VLLASDCEFKDHEEATRNPWMKQDGVYVYQSLSFLGYVFDVLQFHGISPIALMIPSCWALLSIKQIG
jgi:hypothetical protein